ncbi:MAG TPA: hypothetical protein PKM35_01360 [Holophaga sp.]|nr:hypothetical protein [Holophaga sp.]
MLLKLETLQTPMKLVFELSEELRHDPQRVKLTQALTQNKDKPRMGLKGNHGLFGSPEWWANIQDEKMKVERVSGTITRTYFAGQDSHGNDNSFDLKLENGTILQSGIYVNHKQDRHLFRKGAFVAIAYALDELKQQPAANGDVNYSRIVIELAIST